MCVDLIEAFFKFGWFFVFYLNFDAISEKYVREFRAANPSQQRSYIIHQGTQNTTFIYNLCLQILYEQ